MTVQVFGTLSYIRLKPGNVIGTTEYDSRYFSPVLLIAVGFASVAGLEYSLGSHRFVAS